MVGWLNGDVIVWCAELLFLIADFLKRRTPCQGAANELIQEIEQHRLLKPSVHWNGRPKTSTYQDYQLRHRDLAPSHLMSLLQPAIAPPKTAASKQDASVVAMRPNTLLLHRPSATQVKELTEEQRKTMKKNLVQNLFALRKVDHTIRVVEHVVVKYERFGDYRNVMSASELPEAVQLELQAVTADKAATLAADVRALKQLMQLRKDKLMLQLTLQNLMEQAHNSRLFRATSRTGRNQVSRLRRRELCTTNFPPILPPSYIYSRMRRLKTLNGHLQIATYCLTYDKSGKYVITGADDRLIKVWSLATGDLKFTLRGHIGNITDLSVNNSNTLLASSSDDKTVRIWELSTGFPVAVLLGHSSVVNSVRFHPFKNAVVTAADDGRSYCYILPDIIPATGPETKLDTAQRLVRSGAYCATLQPSYSLSHAGSRQGARSCKVLCLAFSRCGNFVVTGSQDGIGRVWDVSILGQIENPNLQQPPAAVPQDPQPIQLGVPVQPPGPEMPMQPQPAGAQEGQPVAQPDSQPAIVVDEEMPLLPLPLPTAEPALVQMSLAPIGVVDNRLPMQMGSEAVPMDLTGDGEAPATAAGLPSADAAASMPAPAADGTPQLQRQQSQLAPIQQTELPTPDVVEGEVPRLPTSEPIALLKGHTGPITNVIYSNKGDQIATSSIKDGTTRVWKWEKRYRKVTHKVLYAEVHDEADELAKLYGITRSKKRATPAVDTLMWTRNDKRLITLHSVKPDEAHAASGDWKQRVRVWDPRTGNLVMTLAACDKEQKLGHVNAVFAMDVHPHDLRVVITAGYDGRVFMWDIDTGRILKHFYNVSPEGELVPMLDGGFMPDGSGFCFTDRIGRLLIFGTGSGRQFSATPVQQYFQHDYAPLITDRNFNVIDREAQMMPHLMESGPLVDIYRIEYPHQPPHLHRNPNLEDPEWYEENRRQRIRQCMESEIKCGVRHAVEDEADVEDFPRAVLVERKSPGKGSKSPRSFEEELAKMSYRLNGDPVLLSELRRRAQSRRRPRDEGSRSRSSPTLDDRDTSVLNLEISSDDDHADEDFQANANADDEDDDEEEEADDDDSDLDEMDDEELIYSREAAQRMRASGNPDVRSTRRGRVYGGGGRTVGGSRSDSAPNRASHRRLRRRYGSARSSDDDESMDIPLSADPTPRGASGRRSFDEDDDDEQEAVSENPNGRPRRRAARSSGNRRFLDSDDDDDDNGSNGDDEAMDTNSVSADSTVGEGPRSQRADSVEDGVVVESNDGFIMGDNQQDKFDRTLTYADMLAARSQQPGGGDPITCAFCNQADDGGMLKLPGDAFGQHPLILGPQRVFVHDQCAIASPLCFNRGGKWFNVTKEIRRGRSITCVQCKTRGATVGCTLAKCPKSFHWKCAVSCGWSMNQIHFFCPEHEGLRSEEERRLDSVDNNGEEPVNKRFGLVFHREWLQQGSLRQKQQYVPQLGDHVVYFPEGHQVYLRCWKGERPTYMNQLRQFSAIRCRVVDIQYAFPLADDYSKTSTIKCQLKLAVLAVPTAPDAAATADAETKEDGPAAPFGDDGLFSSFASVDASLVPTADTACERFTFKFFFHAHDLANFLVLDHSYCKGVGWNWQVGDQVLTPFVQMDKHGFETGAEWTVGVITSINATKDIDGQMRLSPWECLKVSWNDSEVRECSVSPWEIEPNPADARDAKRIKDRSRVEVRAFLSRSITRHRRAALLNEVMSTMNLSIAQDFLYPVGDVFMDYLITIANPMDLGLIKRRLEQGYYRQIEAFVSDARLLSINCEKYNVETSAIAQNSRAIVSTLLTQTQRLFGELRDEMGAAAGEGGVVIAYPLQPIREIGDDENEDEPPPTIEVSEPTAVIAAPAASGDDGSVILDMDEHMEARPVEDSESENEVVFAVVPNAAPDSNSVAAAAGESEPLTTTEAPRQLRSASRVVETEPEETEAVSVAPAQARRTRGSDRELVSYKSFLDTLTASQKDEFREKCEDDLHSVLASFHEALMQGDHYQVFGQPVTEDIAPQYFTFIKNPMDFGTMMENLAKYKSFKDYFADVRLVFHNAIVYNTWESGIGELVITLQKNLNKFLLDSLDIGISKKRTTKRTTPKANGKAKAASSKKKQAPVRKRRRPAVSDDEDEAEDSWDFSDSSDGGKAMSDAESNSSASASSSGSSSSESSSEEEMDSNDDDDSDFGSRRRSRRSNKSTPKNKRSKPVSKKRRH
ncbi:TPA: hypothetical protein N0F65_005789 [Lagenidium giganteum]|uniref:Bromodomain and WD repeat-containing protein 1 n=1 Tax=Lagenidium giganteum TaxID=4803 RepID=A0AAV2YST2_9STRA|nr:TPA: hypothetical protein N0F65_005789 [Lagenidium giganteum]